MTQKQRENGALFLYAFVISAIMLFFCSKCSPAYPLNDWADANVYLSAGKGMLEGRVMYQELYDHKGPLLFALHALCALLSYSFHGVWLMEILLYAIFLFIAYQMLCLYSRKQIALMALPVLGMLLVTCASFKHGNSAEEIALPMVLYPLYLLLRSIRTGKQPVARQLGIAGFLLGCVVWIKFTMVGIPVAICLTLSWLWFREKRLRGALQAIGWMFLGFVISFLPWLIQYSLQGGLTAMLKTYLYDNLFLYGNASDPVSAADRLRFIGHGGMDLVMRNKACAIVLLGGAVWLLLSKHYPLSVKISWLLCFALGLAAILIGGVYHVYYGLVLGALMPFSLIAPCEWFTRLLKNVRASRLLAAAVALVTAAACIACPLRSPNMMDFGRHEDDLMQYRFARIIRQQEDPTMLNYGFLDWGFYTAAGVAPHLKYYHRPNLPLAELYAEQDRYVREGLADFVVTHNPLPVSISGLYTLVDSCHATGTAWFQQVYLYQLTSQLTKSDT